MRETEIEIPDYGTPEYDMFDRAIEWAIGQLQAVLKVQEWSTSGGGTDTLEGDVRSELHDLLKAAGRDDDSIDRLRSMVKLAGEMSTRLAAIRANIEAIIHTDGDFSGEFRIASGAAMRETLTEIWLATDPEYEGKPSGT